MDCGGGEEWIAVEGRSGLRWRGGVDCGGGEEWIVVEGRSGLWWREGVDCGGGEEWIVVEGRSGLWWRLIVVGSLGLFREIKFEKGSLGD